MKKYHNSNLLYLFPKLLFLLLLSFCGISCKKELFAPDQRKLQTTSKIQTISYAEFIDAVNTSGLSGLNELLAPANHGKGGKKLIDANFTKRQFKIDMNAVKKLVLGDTVSYVVSLMPSSPHAVHFQNLTVQMIKNTSIAFLTTYSPNKEWIENWKSGRTLAFSGTLTISKIDTKRIDLTASRISKIEPTSNQIFMDAGSVKVKSKGIDKSISLAPGDCEFYDIYEFVPYTCSSGDWPGYCIWETDISSMGQLEHLPGYKVEKTTVLYCAPPDRPDYSSGGEGGGRGGGATTPTPPSNYDPCIGGSETIWYDNVYGGLKLAIAAVNPCDGGETGQNPIPTNPATEAIQSLIAYLPITDYAQQQYLKNNTNVAVAINNYLNTNGWTTENKEFASWGIGYLNDNPGFNYHLFFDENEFSGINNPPTNITEESVINNGIKIGEVPDDAPQNQNRIIGSAPKRHGNNPEDLQYGTSGNTSSILSSMINKPNAELFASMRSLLWKTSVLSPEMRTLTSQMADKFESNTGGTFENAIITKHVKRSVNYQNFLKKFGEELGKELTEKSGNINQISLINTNATRPIFNGHAWNKFGGLQIAINDTEAHEIRLINFRKEGGVLWYADIEVTIFDNFGLDKNDALMYQGKHAGFAAWWLLQHTKGFKPFVTKIVIKSSIEGRY